MFKIKGINHLVLFVSNLEQSEKFYTGVLGFVVREKLGDQAVFLRANASDNHHDLGLIFAGKEAAPLANGPRIGLYHSAWEVETIQDLRAARQVLQQIGAFAGESDHGNSLSIYAHDPDGNEFEVFWMVPREEWGKREFGVHELHLEAELAKRTK